MNLKYLFKKPERRGTANIMAQFGEQHGYIHEYNPFSDDPYEEEPYDRKCYSYSKKGERRYEGFSESDSYLISYEGNGTHIYIREGIEVIGDMAFAKNHNILSIHLPETLKVIEEGAFRECEKLEEINIPEGVEIIGDGAFKGCCGFEEIKIPPHIKIIGEKAFMGCTGIYKIEIPESIEKLGKAAFWGCKGLWEASLPESLKTIPGFLFYACESLYRVKISSETEYIDYYAFDSCVSLSQINIPENTAFGLGSFHDCCNLVDENGMVIHGENFLYCSAFVNSMEIPDGIKILDADAFRRCTGLEWLTIPDSVNEVIGLSCNIYTGFSKLKVGNIVSKYSNIFCSNDLEEIILSEKTTGIANGAFASNDMEKIVIPAGVKFIGGWAFESCNNLKKVIFKGDAPRIEKDAFALVNTTIYYPEGNPTWNHKVFGSYGGCLTWVAYKDEAA